MAPVQCPDNSTECLLRALLDANLSSSFNWDPLNFAFTAAIGVLALIIAFVTVFQGLLTAGPGRLKASEKAIGIWSRNTINKFNWLEFRYRSTTNVPVLTLDQLKGTRVIWDSDRIKNKFFDYPATWVNLLEVVGLSAQSELNMRRVETDYLPSEIQAAPAFASIEAVVLLAAAAGCDRTDKRSVNEGYPQLSGPSMYVEFRDHSQLGTFASFQQLSNIPTYYQNTLKLNGREMASYALGFLTSWNGYNYTALPLDYFFQSLKFLDRRMGTNFWYSLFERIQNSLVEGLDKSGEAKLMRKVNILVSLLVAASPKNLRVFPFLASGIQEVLEWLCATSKWCVGGHDDIVLKIHHFSGHDQSFLGDPQKAYDEHYDSGQSEAALGRTWIATDEQFAPPQVRGGKREGEDDIGYYPDTLRTCRNWYKSHNTMSTVSPVSKAWYVQCLHLQLQEIDWWLWTKSGPRVMQVLEALVTEITKSPSKDGIVDTTQDVMTATSHNETITHEPKEDATETSKGTIDDMSEGVITDEEESINVDNSTAPEKNPTPEKDTPHSAQPKSEAPSDFQVRNALIFRGILLGVLLSSVLDNSEFLDHGQRIIRFV